MAMIMHNYPRSEHQGPVPIGSVFADERQKFLQPVNLPIQGQPMSVQQQGMPTRIEELLDFQDNMNSQSGLDRLKALQTLGLMGLVDDTYMSEEANDPNYIDTGLGALPQVQMGWGGWIKRIFRPVTKIAKKIIKPISKFAKSKIGRMLVPAAAAFLAPWSMGLSFGTNPFLYSAMAGLGSGVGSLDQEQNLEML